ncbi:hypothetical protein ACFU53_15900 [Streptomyces sp. NPDC057474]|uniref:hypothetical protein n=1 Tax=Streptomyces sp. NPDC057474 TaxID=3346144 RepID=UPI0036D0A297
MIEEEPPLLPDLQAGLSMATHPETSILVAHWLAAGGTLLVVVGSAAQAWFAIVEYRDLLDRTQIGDLARKTLALTNKARSVFWIFTLLRETRDMVRTIEVVQQKVFEVKQEGGEAAQRLAELVRTYLGWLAILVGASAVFVSTVIELAVDYGDATYAALVGVGIVVVVLVAQRILQVVRWGKARWNR